MNLYELCVKIGADVTDVNKGIDETGKKTSDLGEKIKNGLAAVGKAAVVGVTAAATAIGTIGTKAIQAYADYEQLVGVVNGLLANNQPSGLTQVNLVVDGQTLARVLFDPLRGEILQRGVSLA